MLLLRKYARGGVITAITQPPLERIVTLSITKYPSGRKEADEDEVPEIRHTTLVIELLGSHSNVILLDEQSQIMDAIRRVSHDQRRPIQPHIAYTPPLAPPATGDPRAATTAGVAALAGGAQPSIAKALVSAYRGVSPLVAREAVARATGDPDTTWAAAPSADALAAELSALFAAPAAPSLALEDGVPVAFAAYHLDHYPEVMAVDSISAAIERYFTEAPTVNEQALGHAARRAALLRRVEEVRTRWTRQHEALSRELERANALDQLRWEGEMIFAYLHTLAPGQTTMEVEGRTIKLDPLKTAVENAQSRFRAYDKAKGALGGVPERLAETAAQLSYIDETVTLLELAESFDVITGIERELEGQGLLKTVGGKRPPRGPRSQPLRVVSSEGVPIVVGRSAGQNDEVTFKLAQPDDTWLHARGVPGAHVIIRQAGAVGDQTLLEAAGLALYFSKARNQPAADVSVCLRRDVRKVAGGPPGLVTLRQERTLRTRPLAPEAVGKPGA